MSSGHGASELSSLVLGLALIYLVSQVLNILFNKVKLPSVVGDLCAGLLFALGIVYLPSGSFLSEQLSYLKTSEIITMLGELGVIILLLEVGLETEVKKILSTGKEAMLVAIGGVLAPFVCAFALNAGIILCDSQGIDLGISPFPIEQVLFIGLVFAATSIGVTARVFQELKMLSNYNSQIILAAAVIDDVLGLIALSVIVGLVKSGHFEISNVVLIVVKSIVFLGLALWLNPRITAKAFPVLGKIGRKEPLVFMMWILMLCFLFAYLAEFMGLAAIIGAFALGATLDSFSFKDIFGKNHKVEEYIAPIRAFLVPIFFVKVGISIDPVYFFSLLSLILTVLACISKLASGYLLLPFKTTMNRMLVGIGMMPRGEVGLVVAQIGFQNQVLPSELYSALLVAIIATTIIAPIWLQIVLSKK